MFILRAEMYIANIDLCIRVMNYFLSKENVSPTGIVSGWIDQ